MAAITGNVIGNQAINVHLEHCRGISLTGNFIYSGFRHNLLLEKCDDIAIGSNTIGHNYYGDAERDVDTNLSLIDCHDCSINGLVMRGVTSGKTTWTAPWSGGETRKHKGLIELIRSHRININGCQLRDPNPVGVHIEDGSLISLIGCQIYDSRDKPLIKNSVRWLGRGNRNLMASNLLEGTVEINDGVEINQPQ